MHGCIKKGVLLCVLLGFASVCMLDAQESQGDDLTLKIALLGVGDELYFWWGHISLIIEDARTGESRLYDYGLFSFDNENFFLNFALGRLWYSSGVGWTENVLPAYIMTNRDVTLYTLDVPPENRKRVQEFAEKSVLPENKNYLYHHFKDNCSTRIRDIVSLATDGQFEDRYGDAAGRFTFREHVRRHTWFSPPIDWMLNFWMGQGIDVPITVWDEMFLPSEVIRNMLDFEYVDQHGVSRALVSDVETVHQSFGRPGVLDEPRTQWPHYFAFGMFLSLVLLGLSYVQAKYPARGQVVFGICHSLFGLVFGVAGLLLFFMSFFTSHDYTFHNANLLFCNPLLIAMIPLGIRYATAPSYDKRFRPECALRLLWLLVVLGIFASMLIKLLPQFWQDNLSAQLLILPIALTLAFEPVGLPRIIKRIFRRLP